MRRGSAPRVRPYAGADWGSVGMRVQRERMLTVDAAARAVFFAASQEGEGVLNEIVLQPESHQM